MYNKSVLQRASVGGKVTFSSTHFAIVLAALFVIVTIAYYRALQIRPDGFSYDWLHSYRPAIEAMFSGQTPYGLRALPVSNPPWVFLLLSPLALLPPQVGASIMFTAYLFGMGYIAHRMHAKPAAMVAFVLSFVVIGGAVNNQIDFLVGLGLFLPPQWGLFLVLAKPQAGIAVALFWCIEAYRVGGFRQVIRVVAPVSAALMLSFVIYGFWPLQVLQYPAAPWNASLFPWSVLPGLALMWLAVKKNNIKYAYPVSPMLAPYTALHSWFIAMLPLIETKYIILVSLLTWVLKFAGVI